MDLIMEINFECKKCGCIFDCDIGSVTISKSSDRPCFENKIICPKCGERSIDEVLLTELGQSQLTEVTFNFTPDDMIDICDYDSNGFFEGECQGCEMFLPLNDLGLCDDCANKLDRDLIRKRDWDYSGLAFGIEPSKREELRNKIISEYGDRLELIASSKGRRKNQKRKPKKKVKKKRKKH